MNKVHKNAIIFLVIIMRIALNNWMKEIDDDKNLLSLDIPGTHDCVTQYVQFSHISKCQNRNIYEQLCLGIRALDIRVKSNGDRLCMVHGYAKAFNTPDKSGAAMDMADVLKHCYRFLKEFPEETIVFQFKNDSGREMEKCFHNLFYTYIKGNEDKWFLENRVPAMKEVRGKIYLIRRCRMDLNNPDFNNTNTGLDFSGWVEQDTAVPNPLILETDSVDNAVFVIQDRYKYRPRPRWSECIKPFLDERIAFNGIYVINYLSTAGGLKGPENNAKYINAQFMNYETDKSKYYGTTYLDFPHSDLTKKIIKNNFEVDYE